MKIAVAIVIAAGLIAAALFFGSDRYYRMTYDSPERSFPTPPELVLPTEAPVAPNYECEILAALVDEECPQE